MRSGFITLTLIFLALAGVITTGCASSPQSSSTLVKADAANYEAVPIRPLEKADTLSCATLNSKSPMHWKRMTLVLNGCVKENKWQKVEEGAFALTQKEPQSPWGPYFLSLAAEARGDKPRALWMLELALKKAPQEGLLHYQKGRLTWDQPVVAVGNFQRALQLNPKLALAHKSLGLLHARDLEYDKALPFLAQAIDLGESDFELYTAFAEAQAFKGQYDQALRYLDKVLSQRPYVTALRIRQAEWIEEGKKDLNGALNAYKRIQSHYKERKLQGDMPIDLARKINELTVAIRQIAVEAPKTSESGRNPAANKKGEQ